MAYCFWSYNFITRAAVESVSIRASVMKSVDEKGPLKVFLCHAHADTLRAFRRNPVPQGDDMRGLPEGTRLTKDIRKRTSTQTLRADTSGQVRY